MAIIVLIGGEELSVPAQDAKTVMIRLSRAGREGGREQTAEGPLPQGWVPFETDDGTAFVTPPAVAYVREQRPEKPRRMSFARVDR